MKFSKDYFVAIIFLLFTLLGSAYQSLYIYDSFHWVINQSSLDLFTDKIPYKDFFIHYGFLFTLINGLVLNIFNNDLISTMIAASVFYCLGNFNVYLISKRFLDKNLSIYIPVILFLLHPFANHPWPNYQFYFFLTLSILFFYKNNAFGSFLAGFFLSFSSLIYENFLYLCPLIIVTLLLITVDQKKRALLLLGFILPLSIFHTYLYFNDLHFYWYKTFTLNNIFLEIYDTNLVSLILNFIVNFTKLSIFNFFTESYFLFFYLITIINLLFIINFILKFFKKQKFTNTEINLFIISLISLITLTSALHKINIFRFSTGPSIGLIVIIYFINKYFFNFKNYIIALSVLFIASSSVVPIKQSNNKFFPNFEEINSNYSIKNFKYFNNQRWSNDTWKTLTEIDKYSAEFSECKNIDKFINFTNDGFVYMIANQYLYSKQYVFWYDNKRYYKLLFKNYNVDMKDLLQNINFNQNTILFISSKNLSYLKKNFYTNNLNIIDLPYSFKHKRIHLVYPNKCI